MRTLLRQSRVLWLAALTLPIALHAAGQSAAKASPAPAAVAGIYRIAGTIVNAATGEPLRHAIVAALSEEDSHTVAAVASDNDGHFALESLPPAKYQLTASKRGFRTGFYDEHGEYNSAIVTGPGQETTNLVFRLTPGGELHGVITTEGGDPVENAKVMLFRRFPNGKPGGLIGQSDAASTDDTGAYEFGNLPPGDYFLAVSAEPWYALHRNPRRNSRDATGGADSGNANPAAALDVAYPITYFDSTTDEAAANRIVVERGSRQEIDLTLHAVPALRIQVDTPRRADGGIARAELRQTIFGNVVSSESAGFLDSMQTGTTEFDGVAPGHYELVQGDPQRMTELDAAANLQVDPAQGMPTFSVHGTIRGAAALPLAEDCNLTLESADPSHRQMPVQSVCIGGGFNFSSVPPGQWDLTVDAGGKQLPVVSVSTGGHTHAGNLIAVQDRPVAVVVMVSQGSTRVQGFAKIDGKGAPGVMVELIPKDLTAMDGLVRRDQSDSDGSFSLRDVAPGDYTLVAIADGWKLDWADGQAMARYLPGGIAVTVSDRAGKVVTLEAPVPVQSR